MKGAGEMKHAVVDFIRALFTLRLTRKGRVATWAIISSILFWASAQQTASGLEFPMTTTVHLPESTNLTIKSQVALTQSPIKLTEMALVASLSRQVEMARSIIGAKKVAKSIMATEYLWGDKQYACLNQLWTKESHWNYKAHNYRSGAHGIPQALPADKMDVVGTDWRTSPVTQIRWGLRYIDIRYETPCGAWKKSKRSGYY